LKKKKNKKQEHKKAKRHSVKNIFAQAVEPMSQKGFHKIGLFGFYIDKKQH